MVGHQAISEDIEREPGAGVDDGLDKGVLVFGRVKGGLSTIIAVNDLVPHAAAGTLWQFLVSDRIRVGMIKSKINYIPFSMLLSISSIWL
jgi:hypothetical protein